MASKLACGYRVDPANWRPMDRDRTSGSINAMSVDVEEYFQVGAFENTIARDEWPTIASRVEHATGIVLDLFAQKGVKATFFCLGIVAESHGSLIRRIVEEGHELASHGYAHDRVTSFEPEAFRADLRRSRQILEDAGGVAIKGYRAPSFSIGATNLWALSILAEEGYAYSSSIYPIFHDHYGMPSAPRFPFRPVSGADLIEVPVTTVQALGRTVPCGGGGYFRLLPYGLSKWAMRRVNQQDAESCTFYFHPWEVDPDQPRVAGAPLKSRLRHYTNLSIMQRKLARALDDFSWDRMDRVYLDPISMPGEGHAHQAAE